MTPEEIQALLSKVGTEATEKAKAVTDAAIKSIGEQEVVAKTAASEEIKKTVDAAVEVAQKALIEKADLVAKGSMKQADFEKFKTDELAKVNDKLSELEKLETAVREQGIKMNQIIEKGAPKNQNFEEYFMSLVGEKGEELQKLRDKGGFIEIGTKAMKAAGVTSIAGSVESMGGAAPTSPYLPGIGGETLEIFGIARNPNYILNAVDIGSTNQSRLAWINETSEEGVATELAEESAKPISQNKFKLETSLAKKMASYIEITEEFEQDVPNLATLVRRMLQERVGRQWDDVIQSAVIAAATAYSAPALNAQIPFANYWDVLYAMMGQVRVANYIPNSIGIHPYTNVAMQGDKTSQGVYLLPPYKDEIMKMMTQANKISPSNALVGDLKQYKVDIYKEFVLKVGWINDNFITNKFCVLGEVRYHRYISANRTAAIVQGNLGNIRALLDGGSGS